MLYLELGVLAFIVILQVRNFYRTNQDIAELALLFPEIKYNKDEHLSIADFNGNAVEQLRIDVNVHPDFKQLIADTNAYLLNNKGAVDFNILKNIADRTAAVKENQITNTVSIPLYLGLIGTFCGVILGLINIILFKGDITQEGAMETAINGLLTGVSVAMIVSLVGLSLTTWNNAVAFKSSVRIRDLNRNDYYTFLQRDLLHRLDNNLHTILDMLKGNIADFNSQFGENLKKFDDTFGNNISNLKEAVTSMSTQIDTVKENTGLQIGLLSELKRINYDQMVQDNTKLFQKMKEAGPMLDAFVKEHQSFNQNLQSANGLTMNINNIFERITQFENNINVVGTEIAMSKMLGADVLNHINDQLKAINYNDQLIGQYAAVTNDEFKQYLENAHTRIKEIKRKIEKELEGAYDLNGLSANLQNLAFLKSINDNLEEMKRGGGMIASNPVETDIKAPKTEAPTPAAPVAFPTGEIVLPPPPQPRPPYIPPPSPAPDDIGFQTGDVKTPDPEQTKGFWKKFFGRN